MDKNIGDLVSLLDNLPISKWGVGDISGLHPLSKDFSKVISLVFAYKPDFETYNESKFHALTLENKATISEVTETIKRFLDEKNIKYLIPDGKVNENFTSFFH